MVVLATNNDAAYADSATDASVKVHQQDHDALAVFYNQRQAPWRFYVESYGAVGDGTTDDTAAINAAVTAATAYAVAHNRYAEVAFQDRTYLLASAPTQGGTTKGRAQIPLPVIADTAGKITLAFKGVGDAASLPHWNQTTPHIVGTVLKTNRTGLAYDATFGWPSVIGGPTPEQGYGTTGNVWNNLCVVIDGIYVQVPQNPTICGVDLAGVAECHIGTLSVQHAVIPGSVTGPPTTTTFGLRMPYTGNNAYCDIDQYSCEGFFRSCILGEHTSFNSIRSIYCATGLAVVTPAPHGVAGRYACIESCTQAVEVVPISAAMSSNNGGTFLSLQCLDVEFMSSGLVSDASNVLYGEVYYNSLGGGNVGSNGASRLRIINIGQGAGTQTAPAVPATTVAFTNPFWRDCAVTVVGGTVTGIAVDGTSLGVTSGTVFVPSNKTITLTYSAAPSWKWMAL